MAKTLSTKEMTDYLKQAMDLEVSVYSQERALDNSEKYLKKNRPKYIELGNPSSPERKDISYLKPEKPTLDLINIEAEEKKLKDGGRIVLRIALFLVIIGALFIALGVVFSNGVLIGCGVVELIIGGIFLIMNIAHPAKKKVNEFKESNEKKTANYEEAMKQYEKDMKKYENAKKREEKRYLQAKEKAEQEYEIKKQNAKTQYEKKSYAYSLAKDAVNQMRAPLEETKATLEKLYDIGIIFPKYRNLVATSTMYEYFASGRVSELEGPNGAYNLYEAELRQNLIINKMDVIISQLEDIKANQYSLYMELQKTNSTLEGIASDVSAIVTNTNYIADNTQKIADNTQEIAQAAHITAQCAQVTAKNSEALKYIALIN